MKNHAIKRGLVGAAVLVVLLLGWGPLLALAGPARQAPTVRDGRLDFGTGQDGPPTLVVLAADASAIDLRAELPGCEVETVERDGERFTRLYGDGYGHGTQVGLPDLPVLRREVEIPFGAEVTPELVRADYADVSLSALGLYPIDPLQPPQPKVEGERPFQIDRGFYAQGSLFPAFPLSLGEPYIVRGHRVLPVEVWPVAYDPSAGMLRLYREVVFRLRLEGSDVARTEALAERYASPAFESRLAQRILNYNQGRPARRFGPETPIGYLIITADAFYDAMLPFVQLRESRGFDVTMVRCSEIGGCLSASNVQAYIVNAYHTWPLPPSYVLLVGDTDSIATWTGPVIGTSTDLYYGTMDGAGDWHPDIGRGRFPVRTVAQATAMVNKYLAYAQLTGQEPWLKKASFPATCDTGNYPIAEGTHNYVINTHTAPNGYWGRFPNDPQPGGDKLYCITYGATHDDLVEAFNDGRWAIIYSGHGSYSGWEMNFTPTDVQNLTNYGMFPFVASHACLSGNFGQPEVFGETWVLQPNKGALVYWGSSTYSYWDEDDVLERAMFDSLFTPGTPHADVAEMTDDGLAAVEAAYPGSARYYWETYNVLGDPAVKIFLEPELPIFTFQVEPTELEVCSTGTVTASAIVGSLQGYSGTVYLETGPLPVGVNASFDPPYAQAPFTSTLSLVVGPDAAAGSYTIVVTATDHVSYTFDAELELRIRADVPQAPALIAPPDGASDQPFQPTFEWEALASAASYRLQVDPSVLFAAPIIDEPGLADASYTAETPLEGGRCYWWRVNAQNGCGEGPWASPFRFSTVALTTVFFDDIESGPGQWSHGAAQGTDHWQISTAQSHSPTHAWYVPDDPVVTDSRLWNTVPVALGTGSTLTFWHRYQFEGTSYDGAVLEISTNGGASWQDLGPYITANGYNGTVSTCCSNPLGGRQAWVGDLTTWTEVTVDLSAFAGQQAQIRWRIGCDSSVSDVGWYIDDVQITAPLPPNPPATLTRVVPNTGTPFEPTPVTIEGSGFAGLPNARLGETWLLSLTLVSSTTLEAVVPAGMEPGVYDLTLYNGDTCEESTLANAFTVTLGCTPTVFLTSDSPVAWGEPVHLVATVYGTPPFTYTWDMGGPGYGTGLDSATPVFTYTLPGTYQVVVTVTNACGSDTASTTVEVVPSNRIFLPLVLRRPTG